MKKIGIDAISFYTSHYYFELAELAKARGVDSDKFHVGLGQFKMGMPAPDEDIVTLAANATKQVLTHVDVNEIDNLLFATETGIDQSKCAGIYVHRLLNLSKNCRVIELKQACYSATAAIQMAVAMVARNPKKKILVITADISHYGLNTSGESSQGCGAVAMIISAEPRILVIEPHSGLYTDDVMDFWKPNYLSVPMVEGKHSAMVYLRSLEETWKDFQAKSKRKFKDIDYFCFHTPVPKLVEKAQKHLFKINDATSANNNEAKQRLNATLEYARNIGNSYSAALYVSLASLLDNANEDLAGKRVGFYSYGSGCMAEYFTGVVQPNYQEVLDTTFHQSVLNSREALTYEEYEKFYGVQLPVDGGEYHLPEYESGEFRLTGIKNHKRQYTKIKKVVHIQTSKEKQQDEQSIQTRSPGKIILSGEHSVIYGAPAIALAVNRHAHVTITPQLSKMISLNLLSSRYKDSVTIKTLYEVKDRLLNKYENFLDGKCGIREVLQTPFELTEFVISSFVNRLNAKIMDGLNISTESTIPAGCGMGSSAALILCIILAVSRFFKIPVNEDRLLRLAQEAENLQHGKSSQLDLQTSLKGGCVHFQQGNATVLTMPHFPMYVVNTGVPETTTGETVHYVSKHANNGVWNDFSQVTQEMIGALNSNNISELQKVIAENHRLLTNVGVVPHKVQQFIAEIEKIGAAGKICGAGAVKGDHAGIALLVAEEAKQVQPICDRYGYELLEVQPEEQGLHVA